MKDNRNDKTIERNYVPKWRFLIAEYNLVKAKKHPKFRFVQDSHPFHGVSRQTFGVGSLPAVPQHGAPAPGLGGQDAPPGPVGLCQRITWHLQE